MLLDTEISALSDFFAVFHAALTPGNVFWFRGHSRIDYKLAPSALRYNTVQLRDRALGLVADMKRWDEIIASARDRGPFRLDASCSALRSADSIAGLDAKCSRRSILLVHA